MIHFFGKSLYYSYELEKNRTKYPDIAFKVIGYVCGSSILKGKRTFYHINKKVRRTRACNHDEACIT